MFVVRRVLLENNLVVEGSTENTDAGQKNARHRMLNTLSGHGKQVGSLACW
jgi:hypothetical protein